MELRLALFTCLIFASASNGRAVESESSFDYCGERGGLDERVADCRTMNPKFAPEKSTNWDLVSVYEAILLGRPITIKAFYDRIHRNFWLDTGARGHLFTACDDPAFHGTLNDIFGDGSVEWRFPSMQDAHFSVCAEQRFHVYHPDHIERYNPMDFSMDNYGEPLSEKDSHEKWFWIVEYERAGMRRPFGREMSDALGGGIIVDGPTARFPVRCVGRIRKDGYLKHLESVTGFKYSPKTKDEDWRLYLDTFIAYFRRLDPDVQHVFRRARGRLNLVLGKVQSEMHVEPRYSRKSSLELHVPSRTNWLGVEQKFMQMKNRMLNGDYGIPYSELIEDSGYDFDG